jgi:hypothetical protein
MGKDLPCGCKPDFTETMPDGIKHFYYWRPDGWRSKSRHPRGMTGECKTVFPDLGAARNRSRWCYKNRLEKRGDVDSYHP